MKLLTLPIALMLCASILITACDQGMRRPIMEILIPPQNSLEKARKAMEKVNERRTEAYLKAEETSDFSTIFTVSEDIFKEELGFRKGLWVDLVEIYRQENLQDAFAEKLKEGTLGMFYFEYISSFDEIIIEYLRLSFEFPEKNEAELLTLFRDAMRDEKVLIVFL
jgi:hypothetical protein